MKAHPNATIAGGSSGVAALILWLVSLSHHTVPDYVSVLLAGAVVTVLLAVGRDGVRGLAKHLWDGSHYDTEAAALASATPPATAKRAVAAKKPASKKPPAPAAKTAAAKRAASSRKK